MIVWVSRERSGLGNVTQSPMILEVRATRKDSKKKERKKKKAGILRMGKFKQQMKGM